jgi:gamma-glutamyl phosphate reductase
LQPSHPQPQGFTISLHRKSSTDAGTGTAFVLLVASIEIEDEESMKEVAKEAVEKALAKDELVVGERRREVYLENHAGIQMAESDGELQELIDRLRLSDDYIKTMEVASKELRSQNTQLMITLKNYTTLRN